MFITDQTFRRNATALCLDPHFAEACLRGSCYLAATTGFSYGTPLPRPYGFFLERSRYGGAPTIVAKEWLSGHWQPTGGAWFLSTLLRSENREDRIFLDYGQDWEVRGGLLDAMFLAKLICKGGNVEINWEAYSDS